MKHTVMLYLIFLYWRTHTGNNDIISIFSSDTFNAFAIAWLMPGMSLMTSDERIIDCNLLSRRLGTGSLGISRIILAIKAVVRHTFVWGILHSRPILFGVIMVRQGPGRQLITENVGHRALIQFLVRSLKFKVKIESHGQTFPNGIKWRK